MLGIRKAPCWTGRKRLVGRVGRRDLVEGLDSSQTEEKKTLGGQGEVEERQDWRLRLERSQERRKVFKREYLG